VSQSDQHERTADVYVVDAPRAAGVALGAARAGAESTHVLCRHADESTPDFMRRVLARMTRLQRHRRVRALWYVVGSDAAARRSAPLLASLSTLLSEGASLTVVGPGSHQSALFGWIESVMQAGRHDVVVRAQLYTEAAEAPAPRPSRAPLPARPWLAPPAQFAGLMAARPALVPDAVPAHAA